MKQWLLNKLLSYLLVAVNPRDVLKDVRGVIYLGGEQISQQEIAMLKEEVKFIEHSRFWKVITETLRNDAMERGFNKSLSFDDMKTCKLMLYTLDIIESIKDLIKAQKINNA